MDKETLSHYGWIVILVLILSVLLALATPFGNFIAEGFKAAYTGLFDTSNNALGIIIPGAEPHQPNTLHYYQPYKFDFGSNNSAEIVFHKDGAFDIYYDQDGYEFGEVYTTEDPAIYGEGTVEFFDVTYNISEDGSKLTADGQPSGTLIPTPIRSIYMNTEYVCQDGEDWEYVLLFKADGSGTYKEYYQGEEDYAWDIPIGNYKYFDEYFEEHYYDEWNDQTYIERHAIYPNGTKVIDYGDVYKIDCQHLNTEIRNASQYYTGDTYCKDCNRLLEKGTAIFTNGVVPGLYQPGTIDMYRNGELDTPEKIKEKLITPWETLITNNVFEFENGAIGNHDHPVAPCSLDLISTDDCGLNGDLVLPWDGSVKEIYDGAFRSCSSLTGILLPDGIEYIGSHTFAWNTRLTSIVIPNTVTVIGSYAFCGCENLETVTMYDGIVEIYEDAFSKCYSLKNIVIPNSVTYMEGAVFNQCTSLKTVQLSNKMTSIGYGTFYQCSSLESIIIPASVKEINKYAFYECTSLKNITFNEGLELIMHCAFFGCTNLTTVSLPKTLTRMEAQVFGCCNNLQYIYFKTYSWSVTTSSDKNKVDAYVSTNNATTNATNLVSKYSGYHWNIQ